MPTVILNFHGIGEPRRALEPGEDAYWISADFYERTLDLASEADADVAFTFDDGNLSDLDIGAEALNRRGLKAAFFPLAGRLDEPGSLSRADVRTLVEQGHEIGSHGADHVDWRRLNGTGVARELESARHMLEDAAGKAVEAAAIPFGGYDKRVLGRLRARGYTAAYTSDGGRFEGRPWLRPRTSLRGDMTEADVLSVLNGAESAPRRLRRKLAMAKKRLV